MQNKLQAKKIIIASIFKIGIKFNRSRVANQNAVCFNCNISFVNFKVPCLLLGKNTLRAKYTDRD